MLSCQFNRHLFNKIVISFLFTYLFSSYSLQAEKLDGHLVTQGMAINYNSMTPSNFVNKPVQLKQYFVPKSWSNTIADESVKEGWKFLIEDSSHPEMIRILIHPFDRVQSDVIEAALKKASLPSEPSLFEIPFNITESRSLYPTLVNSNQIPVSPRLSMTHGFGLWNGYTVNRDLMGYADSEEYDKLISSEKARFAIYASRLIQKKLKGVRGRYFEIQPDRMVLSIISPDGSLNLGETFRDISSSVNKNMYAVPGFVSNNLVGGTLMALANGYSTPFEFLKEVEAVSRGRALAEFYSLTGFVHSSPHSQNFLNQTNNNFEVYWTSIRDLADLIPTYDSRMEDPKMAQLFNSFEDAREALREGLDGGKDHFIFRHSLVKGNDKVRHLSGEELIEIEKSVSEAFIQTLSETSSVEVNRLKSIVTTDFNNVESNYAKTSFDRSSPIWVEVTDGIRKYRESNFLSLKSASLKSKKLLDEKNKKVEAFLKKIVSSTLRGNILNETKTVALEKLWTYRENYGFNEGEIRAIVTTMLAIGFIPSQDFRSFYSYIIEADKLNKVSKFKLEELFEEALTKKSDLKTKFMVIDFISSSAESLKQKERYFERVSLESLIKNLIQSEERVLERYSVSEQVLIVEKLFISLESLSSKDYVATNLLLFSNLVKKINGLPAGIASYIKDAQSKESNWILERFLTEYKPISVEKNKCRMLFL